MKKTRHDWKEADALTDAEIHAAALADPDAQPLSPERLARMRRVPRTNSCSVSKRNPGRRRGFHYSPGFRFRSTQATSAPATVS